jgi:hypothetical protein
MEPKICREITSQRIVKVLKNYSEAQSGNELGFQYCLLDKPLFDKDGKIDESCSYEDLASYIYFTQTKMVLNKKIIKDSLIGEHLGIRYFLIFRGVGKNTLTSSWLKRLDSELMNVVYADNCTVSDDDLDRFNTTFKQIPYEVRKF